MTPRSQSQPKANDNRAEQLCRKFMLAGIAAFLATAITMSAGLILTNKAKAHLRKEREGNKHEQAHSATPHFDGEYHLVIDIHGDWWQIDRALETASNAAHNEGPRGLHPCPQKDYGTFHDDVTNQDIGTATVTSGPNVEIMYSEPPLILTTTSGWHVQKSVAKQRAAIEREENDGNPTALACEDWETLLNGHQHCTSWGRDLPKVRP